MSLYVSHAEEKTSMKLSLTHIGPSRKTIYSMAQDNIFDGRICHKRRAYFIR